MSKFRILALISFIALTSCGSLYKGTSPYGVKSIIELKSSITLSAELLVVFDTSIWLVKNNVLYNAPFERIKKIRAIELEGKSRSLLMIGSGIASLIAAGLYFGDCNSESTIAGTGFLAVGLSSIIFGATAPPRYRFNPPLSKRKYLQLSNYCRYPMGLNNKQKELILEYYKQDHAVNRQIKVDH